MSIMSQDQRRAQALKTLGLSENNTDSEIRRQYLGLVRKLHTDKGGDGERIKELTAAYAVITGQGDNITLEGDDEAQNADAEQATKAEAERKVREEAKRRAREREEAEKKAREEKRKLIKQMQARRQEEQDKKIKRLGFFYERDWLGNKVFSRFDEKIEVDLWWLGEDKYYFTSSETKFDLEGFDFRGTKFLPFVAKPENKISVRFSQTWLDRESFEFFRKYVVSKNERGYFDFSAYQGPIFYGADLRGVDFTDCDLQGADFNGAQLDEHIILKNTKLDEKGIRALYKAGVRDFTGLNFADQRLSFLDLTQFPGIKLAREAFYYTEIAYSNLTGTDLKLEDFKDCAFDKKTIPPSAHPFAKFKKCNFQETLINILKDHLSSWSISRIQRKGVQDFLAKVNKPNAISEAATLELLATCLKAPISEKSELVNRIKFAISAHRKFEGKEDKILRDFIVSTSNSKEIHANNVAPASNNHSFTKLKRESFRKTLVSVLINYQSSWSLSRTQRDGVQEFLSKAYIGKKTSYGKLSYRSLPCFNTGQYCEEMDYNVYTYPASERETLRLLATCLKAPINEKGELMKRIKFAISAHRNFEGKEDEILRDFININRNHINTKIATRGSLPFLSGFWSTNTTPSQNPDCKAR